MQWNNSSMVKGGRKEKHTVSYPSKWIISSLFGHVVALSFNNPENFLSKPLKIAKHSLRKIIDR
jgi:hypothetical protein